MFIIMEHARHSIDLYFIHESRLSLGDCGIAVFCTLGIVQTPLQELLLLDTVFNYQLNTYFHISQNRRTTLQVKAGTLFNRGLLS